MTTSAGWYFTQPAAVPVLCEWISPLAGLVALCVQPVCSLALLVQAIAALAALRSSKEALMQLQTFTGCWRRNAAALAEGEVPEADVLSMRVSLMDYAPVPAPS